MTCGRRSSGRVHADGYFAFRTGHGLRKRRSGPLSGRTLQPGQRSRRQRDITYQEDGGIQLPAVRRRVESVLTHE